IVMDWELPEMDGLAITRHIREMEKSGACLHQQTPWRRLADPLPSFFPARIPILGMTAHVLPEHGEQCLESGMDIWLSKPVHLQDLKAALQQCVGWNPGGGASTSGFHKAEVSLRQAGGSPLMPQDPESAHAYEI